MNWEVISQYLPLYQKAMWLTLRIGWMGIAFSIIIGLICALIVHYKIPVARQIVKIYIELFRNTPLLVQLFFPSKFARTISVLNNIGLIAIYSTYPFKIELYRFSVFLHHAIPQGYIVCTHIPFQSVRYFLQLLSKIFQIHC